MAIYLVVFVVTKRPADKYKCHRLIRMFVVTMQMEGYWFQWKLDPSEFCFTLCIKVDIA
jgi:hypothetical protein